MLGIGLAATRDFVSFLRHEQRDPGGAEPGRRADPRSARRSGISQSGRYLRDHIGQGFNHDESGRKVFDGVLAHISGVGRVFLNAEFGQPARTNTQHEDHLSGKRVPVLGRAADRSRSAAGPARCCAATASTRG